VGVEADALERLALAEALDELACLDHDLAIRRPTGGDGFAEHAEES